MITTIIKNCSYPTHTRLYHEALSPQSTAVTDRMRRKPIHSLFHIQFPFNGASAMLLRNYLLLTAVLLLGIAVAPTEQTRVVYYYRGHSLPNHDQANLMVAPGKPVCGGGSMPDPKGRCRRIV